MRDPSFSAGALLAIEAMRDINAMHGSDDLPLYGFDASDLFFYGLCTVGEEFRRRRADMDESAQRQIEGELHYFSLMLEKRGFDPMAAMHTFEDYWEIRPGNIGFACSMAHVIEKASALAKMRGRNEIRLMDLLFAAAGMMAGTNVSGTSPDKHQKQSPWVNWFQGNLAYDLTRLTTETPFLDSKAGSGDLTAEMLKSLHPPIGGINGKGSPGRIKAIMSNVVDAVMREENPAAILTGSPGTGKTAMMRGFVWAAAHGKGVQDARLPFIRVIRLSLDQIFAGSNDLSGYFTAIESVIRECREAPHVVLFIDEIHTIVKGGAYESNPSDTLGNHFKQPLSNGEMRMVGCTTDDEMKKSMRPADPAFVERFALINVPEPSVDETIRLLAEPNIGLLGKRDVDMPPAVLRLAVHMAQRHCAGSMPRKAVDLARRAMEIARGRKKGGKRNVVVRRRDVCRAVMDKTGIDVEKLSASSNGAGGRRMAICADDIVGVLSRRVIGQDAAVKGIAEEISSRMGGFSDSNTPSSALLLGPTGTGKTELAKAVAEFVYGSERHMVRIDGGAHSSIVDVSKLIGAGPGLLRSDEEGTLTGPVRSNPDCLVLIDELEKFHPEALRLLLSVLDEGFLTDNHGNKVNFSRTIIIMTSNQGVSCMAGPAVIGFQASKREEAGRSRLIEAAKEKFPPELMGRIGQILIFDELSRSAMRGVVRKVCGERNAHSSVASIPFEAEMDDMACDYVVDHMPNREFGAREIRNTYDRLVYKPLIAKALGGELPRGSNVKVRVDSGGLYFLPDEAHKCKPARQGLSLRGHARN